MLSALRRFVIPAVAVGLAVALTGCNGEGIELKVPDLTERPPPDPIPPDGGGDDDDTAEGRFRGTYITSYADDFTSATASSPSEYAGRIVLDQSGTTVSGTGEMARFFRTGPFNNSQFEFSVSGSAARGSNDGLIVFNNRQNRSDFDRIPIWAMRRAGSRLVGIYGEFDNQNRLTRSGHAVWVAEERASAAGTWVAAAPDTFAVEGILPLDRVWRVELAEAEGNTLTGSGGYVARRLDEAGEPTNFTVSQGGRQQQRIGVSFGGPDLGDTEFQHLGFFAANEMHTAYGQFRNRQNLVRLGTTAWIRGRAPDAAAINGTWIASFSDSRASSLSFPRSYTAVITLELGEGNTLTGRAHILDETDETAVTFRSAELVSGEVVGSRLRFQLEQTRATFDWDLRVGNNILAGVYRRLNAQGAATGTGSASFYRAGTPDLQGTWVAAFVDRVNEFRPPETQLAIVQITDQGSDGSLSGTGRLQLAAEIEELERVFTVTGTVRSDHPSGRWITWTWAGSDLAGETVWNLRQQSGRLVGSYTNFTQNGELESYGHAIWFR